MILNTTRAGDRLLFYHVHARLIDAIQAGAEDAAYGYARLLAWCARRIEQGEGW